MRSSDRDDEPAESAGLSRDPGAVIRRLLGEAAALDQAISVVVADTPTPTLDVPLTWVSNAANYSAIWVVIAVALAAKGGKRGRRAALRGLTAIGATSATANLVAKRLFPRTRPERSTTITGRRARMPESSSFPSGHTASAFAFATTVSAEFPWLSLPLYGLATTVGYSRIHVGVHHASDVMAGEILGLTVGTVVREALVRPRLRRVGLGRYPSLASSG